MSDCGLSQAAQVGLCSESFGQSCSRLLGFYAEILGTQDSLDSSQKAAQALQGQSSGVGGRANRKEELFANVPDIPWLSKGPF